MSDQDPFAVLVDDDAASEIIRVLPIAADAPPAEGGSPAGQDRPRPRKKAARPPASGARPKAGASDGPGGGERPPRRPPPVDDADATRRGWVVIGVTVVVGLLVFFFGVHRPAETVQTSSETVGTTPNVTTRNDAPPITQTAPGTTVAATPSTKVAPAELKIIVANGVSPQQTIAGPVVTKLASKGYSDASAVDLSTVVTKSVVYFTDALEADAQAVALAAGLKATDVAAMPAKPPTTVGTAKVLVVIGTDNK